METPIHLSFALQEYLNDLNDAVNNKIAQHFYENGCKFKEVGLYDEMLIYYEKAAEWGNKQAQDALLEFASEFLLSAAYKPKSQTSDKCKDIKKHELAHKALMQYLYCKGKDS